MEYLKPKKERFEQVLDKIYGIRSKDLHAGKHYPLTATVGASPMLPSKIMLEMGDLNKEHFPPVTWFERVVNIALRTFLERSIEKDKKTDASIPADS